MQQTPVYAKAQELINWLRQDPEIRNMVIENVFDSGDQVDLIKLAADSYEGAITVTPLDATNSVNVPHQAGRTLLDTTLGITIFTVNNATLLPEGYTSVIAYQDAITYSIIRQIQRWPVSVPGAPSQSPRIQDYSQSDNVEEIPNLAGKIIRVTFPLVY